MDTVLNKHTTSIFRQPPEDTSSIFIWNTATQYKWQTCGWFKLGKLNDKYHIIFFTNTVFNAAVLCTTSVLQFLLLFQMKQERNEISRPFRNANYCEFYICGWIYSQHNCKSYMKLLTHEWNKYKGIYHQA
jgi:hypothetical protein